MVTFREDPDRQNRSLKSRLRRGGTKVNDPLLGKTTTLPESHRTDGRGEILLWGRTGKKKKRQNCWEKKNGFFFEERNPRRQLNKGEIRGAKKVLELNDFGAGNEYLDPSKNEGRKPRFRK